MKGDYEIDDLAKEECWRMFRIMGELVEGFDKLAGIEPAVTIYGSARIVPDDKLYQQTREIAYCLGQIGFSIISGGGPGAMEAANRGALEAGVTSAGLNIKLPEEQKCNDYTTISITFNHFFARKVMLVKYASAFVIVPGGLGTLDELTEVLTLIQTQKIRPFPVILFDSSYWSGLMEWLKKLLLSRNYISENDVSLLRICDTTGEVVEAVQKWYLNQEIAGRDALME